MCHCLSRTGRPQVTGISMWGLTVSSANAAILLLLSLCPGIVAAQPPPWQRPHQQRARAYSLRESAPDLPLRASLSLSFLPPRALERLSENVPQVPSFEPPTSYHQTVNFNLLLPRGISTRFASRGPDESRADRSLPATSAFAQDSAPAGSNRDAFLNRWNDPQFYARHIPGVGPVVERMFQESRAHPRLTRVIELLQPQF